MNDCPVRSQRCRFVILTSPFPLLLVAVFGRRGDRANPLHLRGEPNVIARQVSIFRRPAPDARVFHFAPDRSADYRIFVRSKTSPRIATAHARSSTSVGGQDRPAASGRSPVLPRGIADVRLKQFRCLKIESVSGITDVTSRLFEERHIATSTRR